MDQLNGRGAAKTQRTICGRTRPPLESSTPYRSWSAARSKQSMFLSGWSAVESVGSCLRRLRVATCPAAYGMRLRCEFSSPAGLASAPPRNRQQRVLLSCHLRSADTREQVSQAGPSHQGKAVRLVVLKGRMSGSELGCDSDSMQHTTRGSTYIEEVGTAEAGAAVEPVIVAELVDLDAPPVGRLMRHGVCHHRRLLFPAFCGDALVAREEVGRDVEMLLQREFDVGGIAEESERRHFGGRRDARRRCARERSDGRAWRGVGWGARLRVDGGQTPVLGALSPLSPTAYQTGLAWLEAAGSRQVALDRRGRPKA